MVHRGASAYHGAPALLERRGMAIGEPTALFDRLAGLLGEMNLAHANIQVGVSDQPDAVWREACRELPWRGMRLLWATRRQSQARRMADLLRSWDAKLFRPEPDPHAAYDGTTYAYVIYM